MLTYISTSPEEILQVNEAIEGTGRTSMDMEINKAFVIEPNQSLEMITLKPHFLMTLVPNPFKRSASFIQKKRNNK